MGAERRRRPCPGSRLAAPWHCLPRKQPGTARLWRGWSAASGRGAGPGPGAGGRAWGARRNPVPAFAAPHLDRSQLPGCAGTPGSVLRTGPKPYHGWVLQCSTKQPLMMRSEIYYSGQFPWKCDSLEHFCYAITSVVWFSVSFLQFHILPNGLACLLKKRFCITFPVRGKRRSAFHLELGR